MQLGKKDTSSSALVAELTEEVVTEEADSNPWATDDLIDINADQDDWSEWSIRALIDYADIRTPGGAFETAPVASVQPVTMSLDDVFRSFAAGTSLIISFSCMI